MAKINVLPRNIAELIAAGEVVERPASVIKELVENSIDAGASSVTVEIQHGGVTYMRVTDNGCGISRDDVKTAFLRHATSKIREENDLNRIGTLGFRGEALAAVCAVARVELLTCTAEEQIGTHYAIEGGIEQGIEDAGCPKGTTIIVRDLFFNTPARMKFLKTDVAESNAVGQIMDRIALSHPEIAVKFIRDGKTVLTTSGDGKMLSTIYSVLGRDFHSALIPANNSQDGVTVEGYVCKPVRCRPNRNGQYFFLNGRLVKSGTACAALEQAYKNSAMVGKFPCCVLFITVPFDTVDVNVHPAKTEVRFTDEKRVFGCIYYAVKTALEMGDSRPEMVIPKSQPPRFVQMSAEQFRQSVIEEPKKTAPVGQTYERPSTRVTFSDSSAGIFAQPKEKTIVKHEEAVETTVKEKPQEIPAVTEKPVAQEKREELPVEREPEKAIIDAVKYIGEAFSTYIIVQKGDSLYIIDKHAAHERILFEKLKREQKPEQQLLLASVSVTLPKNEYTAIIENPELLSKIGFEVEDFGEGVVIVSAVPALLKDCDIAAAISEIADNIIKTGRAEMERIDDIYHIVACRSAIKAGNISSAGELAALAEQVLANNDIMYCPHGRPVAMKLSRREIEKQFGRIQ